MPTRAVSHPTLVRIPSGTALYDGEGSAISVTCPRVCGKEVSSEDHIIYRHKRNGKWSDMAIYQDIPVHMPENRLVGIPAGVRTVRARIKWRDCVILNAKPNHP